MKIKLAHLPEAVFKKLTGETGVLSWNRILSRADNGDSRDNSQAERDDKEEFVFERDDNAQEEKEAAAQLVVSDDGEVGTLGTNGVSVVVFY